MAVVRMRGLKIYISPKNGKRYCYHRASGRRIMAEVGTPEFLREVAAAEATTAPKPKAIPGSLGIVIAEQLASPDWAALKPATRLSYERAAAALKDIHDMPIALIDRPFIVRLRDRIAGTRGRWMANYACIAFLSQLFEFAKDRGWAKANPAMGAPKLKRDKSQPKQNRSWTPEECRAALNAASPSLRLPIALALFAGARKGDVLALPKTALKDGKLTFSTSKTDRPVIVPVHPDLAAIIRRDMRHEAKTICANGRGEPWTETGFNSCFHRLIRRLERQGLAEGLTFHGCRHTAGTRLREAGADADDIRRLLGHQTLAMAQKYSEGADVSDQLKPVVVKMNVLGTKRQRRLSNHATEIV